MPSTVGYPVFSVHVFMLLYTDHATTNVPVNLRPYRQSFTSTHTFTSTVRTHDTYSAYGNVTTTKDSQGNWR